MSDWRPMAEAPKDGTRILALTKDGAVVTAEWKAPPKEGGRHPFSWVVTWHPFDGVLSVTPKCWMPTPPPPSPAELKALNGSKAA